MKKIFLTLRQERFILDLSMTDTNKNNDWKDREVGALWKQQGRNQSYLSGHVVVDELGTEKKMRVVVFSNRQKKSGENTPDFRIYLSKDRNEEVTATAATSSEEVEENEETL